MPHCPHIPEGAWVRVRGLAGEPHGCHLISPHLFHSLTAAVNLLTYVFMLLDTNQPKFYLDKRKNPASHICGSMKEPYYFLSFATLAVKSLECHPGDLRKLCKASSWSSCLLTLRWCHKHLEYSSVIVSFSHFKSFPVLHLYSFFPIFLFLY